MVVGVLAVLTKGADITGLVHYNCMRLVCPILGYMMHRKFHKLIFYKFMTTNWYSWCSKILPSFFHSIAFSLSTVTMVYFLPFLQISSLHIHFFDFLSLMFNIPISIGSSLFIEEMEAIAWAPFIFPPLYLETLNRLCIHFFNCIGEKASIAVVSQWNEIH